MNRETYESMDLLEKLKFVKKLYSELDELKDMLGNVSAKWQKLSKTPKDAIEHFRKTESVVLFDEDDNVVYPCGMEYKVGALHFQHLEHCVFCEKFSTSLKSFLWVNEEARKNKKEQKDK